MTKRGPEPPRYVTADCSEPPRLLSDDLIRSAAQRVCKYVDVSTSVVQPPETPWRLPAAFPRPERT